MAFDIRGWVGQQVLNDSSPAIPKVGRAGEWSVSELHAPYYQQTKYGNVFAAISGAVAPGTAVGTTAAFALANPAGSGKDLVILTATAGYVSGTLGPGYVAYCASLPSSAAAASGTTAAITAANMSKSPTAAFAYTTATVPASPAQIGILCSMGAFAASSATQPFPVKDELRGGIIIPPGGTLSIQGVTVGGTSPLLVFGLTWEEVFV